MGASEKDTRLGPSPVPPSVRLTSSLTSCDKYEFRAAVLLSLLSRPCELLGLLPCPAGPAYPGLLARLLGLSLAGRVSLRMSWYKALSTSLEPEEEGSIGC